MDISMSNKLRRLPCDAHSTAFLGVGNPAPMLFLLTCAVHGTQAWSAMFWHLSASMIPKIDSYGLCFSVAQRKRGYGWRNRYKGMCVLSVVKFGSVLALSNSHSTGWQIGSLRLTPVWKMPLKRSIIHGL